MKRLALLVALTLALSACYEHPEACMDVRAANFDVKADKACESCCKYPNLNLELSHVFEGIPVDTNIFLNLEENPGIRVRSLLFFLSDFRLTDGLIHEQAGIEEAISVGITENEKLVYIQEKYSAAKLRLGPARTIVLGTFSEADLYQGLHFNFGIAPEINHAALDKIPASHTLYTRTADDMYIDQEEGFNFLKMVVELENQTQRSISMSGDEWFQQTALENEFDFRERTIRSVKMEIEYKTWLNGINFNEDSDDQIKQKLKENFKFSVNFL